MELSAPAVFLNSGENVQSRGQSATAVFQGNHGLGAPPHRIQERRKLGAQRLFRFDLWFVERDAGNRKGRRRSGELDQVVQGELLFLRNANLEHILAAVINGN